MNIFVHYPENPESLSVLHKKVAVAHADAVLRYIQRLHCPKEQKLEMINKLKEKGLQ